MNEGERENRQGSPCPPKRKGAKTTDDNKRLLSEYITLLWEYVIEVQDIIATIRALADNPEYSATIADLLRVKKPAQIIREMVDDAKGAPICANGNTGSPE